MERFESTAPGSSAYGPPASVRVPPQSFRWGAVFAGAFVALGLWALLHAFGLAIGLSTLDPSNPSTIRAVGLGTGIWSLVVPLIALFVGGLVTARVAGPIDRTTGALHGATLWGLTTVAGIAVVGMVIGSLVSGVVQLGSGAAQSAAGGGGALNAQQLMEPINERLREQGKPELTPTQMQSVLRDLASAAVAQGGIDRQTMVEALRRNTPMSEQDANDVAVQLEQQIAGAGQQAQSGVGQAADVTGKAFWGIFLALLLGLVSAVLGATAGVGRKQRAAAGALPEARQPA